MVTWGSNTVHNLPASAPGGVFGASPAPATGFSFGSPAPAPSTTAGGFGSSSFGAPSPGGLFGSSPAPSGSFFGTQSSGSLLGGTPATSGGLFGSSSAAPSPGGGLFGSAPSPFGASAPSGGLFGSSFGQPQQQQPQAQQIPVQAAMAAHLDASARQEEARVTAKLEKINKAYTGTEAATDSNSAKFSLILYQDISSEQRQQLWMKGVTHGTPRPVLMPQPAQISYDDWVQAHVRNPDYTAYMPVALVGADAVQARLTYQQQQSQACVKQVEQVTEAVKICKEQHEQARKYLESIQVKHEQQRKRLLQLMCKVELVRCFNFPLQPDELKAFQRLAEIQKQVEEVWYKSEVAVDRARTMQPPRQVSVSVIDEEESKRLLATVKEHRRGIAELTQTAKRDVRDLKLVKKRVSSSTLSLPGGHR